MGNMNEKSDYLMFFRGKDWDEGLTDAELEQAMARTNEWFDGLFKRGLVKGGAALGRQSSIITGKHATITDGPFAESKEAIGGSLVVGPVTHEEALEIARTNPTVPLGVTIELRQILEECPVQTRARIRLGKR